MTHTLKSLGLKFKRYDIDHPTGPNFRAIKVTEKNKQALFRYVESLEGDGTPLEYDPTKNRLSILQWRWYTLTQGGRRRRRQELVLVEGDCLVQYHDASWERLTPDEFDRAIMPKIEFKTFKFGGDKLRGVQITIQNGQQIVNYINANGGRATVSARKHGDIRVYQHTSGRGWTKKDWRVASPGDYVVHDTNGTFYRVLKSAVGVIEFDN